MKMKKILAVLMSLCMTAGVVSYGAPVITQSITAQAAEIIEGRCYSFDTETGKLTLFGLIDDTELNDLKFSYRRKVKSITAYEGTILPEDCSAFFTGFYYCTSIKLKNVNTSNVKTMQCMFGNLPELTTLEISGFDTSKVTDMDSMFSDCSSLTTLDVSSFDTSKVTDMDGMFDGCSGLTTLDVSKFDTSNVTSMFYMFKDCSNLTNLDLSSFDTRNVTITNGMFYGCNSLTTIDLSSFDTSKVTDMGIMFDGCSSLHSLDISSFDTSNVTNMRGMFRDCTKLTTLDLSNFDTFKVIDMTCMFEGCSGLISIDVSSFDTSNVTTMFSMFYDCRNLTTLDLSSFVTSNVSSYYLMFSNCSALTTLDLSNFDTRNESFLGNLFNKCYSLKSITIGENFTNIAQNGLLTNGKGWVNAKDTSTVVSGDGEYAVIENVGKNTYKRLPIEEETKPTYPTNIKVEYSEKYHQARLTWDKVEGADRYGIAVYLAGKWRVQTQNITDTIYTSPKNLTPGKTYKVAIAARVNGKWDTANAIKNAVTITIK